MPGKSHPKHPRCPKCGKAMYKVLPKSKPPKKGDPWRYCRNKSCELFLQDQSISDPHPTVVGAKAVAEEKKRGDMIADASGSPEPTADTVKVIPPNAETVAPPETVEQTEPVVITKARERIRAILKKAVPGEYDHNIVGVALALVSQETGNHSAANALIDDYDLAKKFKITKVEPKKAAG